MSEPAKNIAAVLHAKATPLVLEERPIPIPGEDEILVRNHYIALNPIDWKRQEWGYLIQGYPTILGSDVAGVVESVGPSVTSFQPGDRVIGAGDSFVSGNPEHSSLQTYTIVPATTAGKLPDGISLEQGATIPQSLSTAAIALGRDLDFHLPAKDRDSALLVWGGACAVGSFAIQLGKLMGFVVYTSASPVHHEYLKSLGAATVFDYHSPTVVDDIVKTARDAGLPIKYAIDAVSTDETLAPTADILLKAGDGKETKLAHMLPWAEGLVKPDGVWQKHTAGESIWGDNKDLSIWLYHEYLPKALQDGTIVPLRPEVIDGGIGGLQTALDTLKAGVSGKKLMVKVD